MAAFVCARCEMVLTVPVSRVALPVHAPFTYGNGMKLRALMQPGTYAVYPEPTGPPWRRWAEVTPEEAEAHGVFAPVFSLSGGAAGRIALAPGAMSGTAFIPELCGGGCCGTDGRYGPNLACLGCGTPVATRYSDCSIWDEVRLEPDAVRRVDTDDPEPEPVAWEELADDPDCHHGSPVEPSGNWRPEVVPAVTVALAQVVAASGGTPVAVPNGRTAELFRSGLDALLGPAPAVGTGQPRTGAAVVAAAGGPGVPRPAFPVDVLLVPIHPQTGEVWRPSGRQEGPPAALVPVAAAVWRYLVHGDPDPLPMPTRGVLPDGLLGDYPLPLHPWPLRPSGAALLHTLARMPAVREPWLRAIYDLWKSERYWW